MKSLFFSSDEMNCPDGTKYPEEWKDRISVLLRLLDKIQVRFGWHICIIDGGGYRTPEFNKQLIERSKDRNGVSNVAINSQHVQGRAADIRPMFYTSESNTRLLGDLVEHMFLSGDIPELGGLGRYSDFIHVDIRNKPNGKLVTWTAVTHGGER